MEMIPGRITGCADITDHFALLVVTDFDVISISATPGICAVRRFNRSVRGGENRRPCRGCDVRPIVVGGLSGERILPISEVGGYGEAFRQRSLENPCSFPDGIR